MALEKLKILAVDDDQLHLSLLKVVLTNKGHDVVTTSTPMEALQLANQEKPDLIILDIYMPGMDGMEVLNQVRSNESTRRTPVLMLTAADQIASAEHAFELGASGYLVKPVNPVLLEKKISDLSAKRIESQKPSL